MEGPGGRKGPANEDECQAGVSHWAALSEGSRACQ